MKNENETTSNKIKDRENNSKLLFKQKVRWANGKKPVYTKNRDVVKITLDISKKYAYAKKLKKN